MEKHTIINLKIKRDSNRAVERKTRVNRKTVAKYWNEYVDQSKLLNDDISEVQEAIVVAPKYDSYTRVSRKYTDEIDHRLDQILAIVHTFIMVFLHQVIYFIMLRCHMICSS